MVKVCRSLVATGHDLRLRLSEPLPEPASKKRSERITRRKSALPESLTVRLRTRPGPETQEGVEDRS